MDYEEKYQIQLLLEPKLAETKEKMIKHIQRHGAFSAISQYEEELHRALRHFD